jgi:zinc transporter, ZIP family
MNSNIGIALLLTTGAGLATTIGSLIGLAVRKPGPRFMGFTLGFSAGVMILVSFVELLQGSIESIGFLSAHLAFFLGMISFFLIDTLIPHDYIAQHDHKQNGSTNGLMRTGMLIALGIGVHNFPEGLATFAGALEDINLGVAIAVAIAIHNIPEGLAVSAPIYAATGSRKKAFLWSFLSGVSEPIGAGLAAIVLLPFLTPTVVGWLLAVVAGIMIAISLDEIIPVAKNFSAEHTHTPIIGIITGMFVMAVSLWLLK